MQLDNKLARKIVHDILKKNGIKTTDKCLMHPVREWFIGLSVALLILSFSLNESINLYLTYDKIDSTGRTVADTALIYRGAEVSDALLFLETRAAKNRSSLSLSQVSAPLPQANPAAIPATDSASTTGDEQEALESTSSNTSNTVNPDETQIDLVE